MHCPHFNILVGKMLRMKQLIFLAQTLGLLLLVTVHACTSKPEQVQETVVTDSTFNDTGVVNAEDTAIMNYAPANETFVDEGSDADEHKEKIKIEE